MLVTSPNVAKNSLEGPVSPTTAISGIAARACRSLRKGNKQSRSCPNCEGRLTSFTATTASQSSTKHGAIPPKIVFFIGNPPVGLRGLAREMIKLHYQTTQKRKLSLLQKRHTLGPKCEAAV